MRPINFRAKRLDNGKWIYGFISQTTNGKWEIRSNETKQIAFVNPDTIGQFTGLTDCKGKEIYEGDILDTKTSEYCPNGYQFICKWIDSGFALIYQGRTYGEKCSNPWMNKYPLCIKNVKDLCIIGNIHDNPELLKQDRQ